MKKVLVTLLIVALAVCAAVSLVACKGEGELHIVSIEAKVKENTNYKVGDTFATSTLTLTAKLSDGTEEEITSTSSVTYDKTQLKLSNGKFTEAGEFTLKVKFLSYETTVNLTVVK